ncbi:MAG: dihydrolipoyl dehydrogenase [Arenicellales bacterium]|nr:dihydrolipoyl dehydrogenase [Arenicellales bacterium]
MAEATYDVVVIGAGPAGYVCAIRCAQLGLRTACVDQRINNAGEPAPGGTCLNVGCIPSKALLDSSLHVEQLHQEFTKHGIFIDTVELDIPQMMERKDRIIAELTDGIGTLFKANGVTAIHGYGRLLPELRIEVTPVTGSHTPNIIDSRHVVIATGAEPMALPGLPFDGDHIIDSSAALSLLKVPEALGIIGAGVVGLELGSVWRRLGAKVTILEATKTLLPAADPQIAREAQRQFKKQNLNIHLDCRVTSATVKNNGCEVIYLQGEQEQKLTVDKLIVAIGRQPHTDGLLDPATGLTLDSHGFIEVDENCLTGEHNVWAIGDSVHGPMLAHKASEEGVAVAERIATGQGHIDRDVIPWIIYTDPEIAWVGLTEVDLKQAQQPYSIGLFPFAATGRAKAQGKTDGFVKILSDNATDQILGIHMIGSHISELIGEAVLAMKSRITATELSKTIHAHPTLSEAIHEAALSAHGRAIHITNR